MKLTRILVTVALLMLVVVSPMLALEDRIDTAANLSATAVCMLLFGLPFTMIHDAIKKDARERQAAEEYKRELAAKIRKTQYMNANVSTTRKTSTSSAIGRAVVGGAIAGDVGAIVGASTAKQKVKSKHTTTFLVLYKDGHKSLETVADESLEYQVYVDKLEIE